MLAAILTGQSAPVHAQPFGTGFVYQGELKQGGTLASGTFDLQFRLFDSLADGSQLGPTLCSNNVDVDTGRFTASLDFGPQFNGQQRFLEILVRPDTGTGCEDAGGYTTLIPRQPLSPAPHAVYAETAGTALNASLFNGQGASFFQNAANISSGTLGTGRLSGAYTNALTLSNAGNSFSGIGTGLTALNAANVSSGTLTPARGGTGTSVGAATTGHVLKWNGSAFTPQADSDTTYSAGSGMLLTGTSFSIPTSGVTSTMILDGNVFGTDLASDLSGLLKVSGGAMRTDGTSVGIGAVAPTSTLHVQTAAPVVAIQSTANGGSAQLDLTETVTGSPVGGRLFYSGAANTFSFGTVNTVGGPFVPAIVIPRGSTAVSFPGSLSVTSNLAAGSITIDSTTRSMSVPPTAFIPTSSSSSYFVDATGLQNTASALTETYYYAPISLPEGATITGVSMRYLNDSTDDNISLEIHKVTLSSASLSATIVAQAAGASTLIRTANSAALSFAIDNSTTSYSLAAHWKAPFGGASHIKLIHVRVDYTITTPLP